MPAFSFKIKYLFQNAKVYIDVSHRIVIYLGVAYLDSTRCATYRAEDSMLKFNNREMLVIFERPFGKNRMAAQPANSAVLISLCRDRGG